MLLLYTAQKKVNENPNFTEDDWCDVNDPKCGAYELSKTFEEQRLFSFIKENNGLFLFSQSVMISLTYFIYIYYEYVLHIWYIADHLLSYSLLKI